MKKNFLNDRSYTRTNATLDGHTLIYPDQIQNNKTKLVVHHTATAYSTDRNEEQIKIAIQQIYKYHTLTRDFGDIGYNFLIDHLGNIYEGRAGGEGAVGMHAANNNVGTVGISLLGNFEETQPTQAQIDALTDLLTALAKKYNIDPGATASYFQLSSTSPYITAKTLPTIVGHGDIAATACPGESLHTLLPYIRAEIGKRLKGSSPSQVPINTVVSLPTKPTTTKPATTTPSATTPSSTTFSKLIKLKEASPKVFTAMIKSTRNTYTGSLPKATNLTDKLTYSYTLPEIKSLLSKDIVVLLYELTTQYKTFDLICEKTCTFQVDGTAYTQPKAQLTFTPQGIKILLADKSYTANEVVASANDGLITIANYARKSYAGIPRNTFHGTLIFHQEKYQTLEGKLLDAPVVINKLPFTDYLKGVVETNDQESLEKNKVMALIAKNYALFYLEKKNIHPSIPASASFSAIDSPEMFQKYVGAGAEKTLTKRYQALEATKNQIVLYEGKLPILPYFSCSVGFTLSAQEKRGWKDTPYLISAYDFSACKSFEGHGVGLSGKGAEYMAKKGMKAEDILKWYYEGITLSEV
ncbi:MAG: N-acetylmuramoyl-L-alanine amidase [Candidatus Peribacteria bacterium]|jgi:peptidoglycan hydrolase-like amidase|nr:N-acetylmuramoyl-L-alanine amidase [Candidatus Peribacteria bacterium]